MLSLRIEARTCPQLFFSNIFGDETATAAVGIMVGFETQGIVYTIGYQLLFFPNNANQSYTEGQSFVLSSMMAPSWSTLRL